MRRWDGTAIRQTIGWTGASGECSRRKSLKIRDPVFRVLRFERFYSGDQLGSYGGREAFCIEFETIVGQQRLPGGLGVRVGNMRRTGARNYKIDVTVHFQGR